MKRFQPTIELCLDDLAGPSTGPTGFTPFTEKYAGRLAVERIFDIIEKAKSAIHCGGAKLLDFKFDNTPTRELNPDGCIATLTFDVVTKYECSEVKLDLKVMVFQTVFGDTDSVALVNFHVKL